MTYVPSRRQTSARIPAYDIDASDAILAYEKNADERVPLMEGSHNPDFEVKNAVIGVF